jgi:thioesterase domain-containing protein
MPLAPESPLDILLVALWSEVLGRPVGIRDSLAELGASDADVTRLVARIEAELNVSAALQRWNPPGTIEALAAVLARDGVENGRAPTAGAVRRNRRVVTRNAAGTRPPFVFLHGDFNGAGFYCLKLGAELGPAQPLHALMPHGFGGEPIPDTIEAMARDHLATLRGIQPRGPYHLGGHCNGGLIAYEMARALEADGERVASLILIASDVRSRGVPISGDEGRPALRWSHWKRLREAGHRAVLKLIRHRGALAVAERRRAQMGRNGAYARALRGYVPRPYRGRMVLLWPQDERVRHPGDPTQGWGPIVPRLDVRPIVGGHLTCITTYIGLVAAEISRVLAA